MQPDRWAAFGRAFRGLGFEPAVASDVATAMKSLSKQSFDLVVSSVTLRDGTWCTLARAADTDFFVCADRSDDMLCGEVVCRAGYYAISPPHEWRHLGQLVRQLRPMPSGRRPSEPTYHYPIAV
jgi:hypothetical protein